MEQDIPRQRSVFLNLRDAKGGCSAKEMWKDRNRKFRFVGVLANFILSDEALVLATAGN